MEVKEDLALDFGMPDDLYFQKASLQAAHHHHIFLRLDG
jgi:hypothetical protein